MASRSSSKQTEGTQVLVDFFIDIPTTDKPSTRKAVFQLSISVVSTESKPVNDKNELHEVVQQAQESVGRMKTLNVSDAPATPESPDDNNPWWQLLVSQLDKINGVVTVLDAVAQVSTSFLYLCRLIETCSIDTPLCQSSVDCRFGCIQS